MDKIPNRLSSVVIHSFLPSQICPLNIDRLLRDNICRDIPLVVTFGRS